MADSLDSIVKGAPAAAPARDVAKAAAGTSPIASSSAGKTGDPLNHTPSSPSMIYLNLLILEASLRAQYLELRARRRHHSFFLTLLTLWTAAFGYALWFAPREDGVGVGGSVYWVVETTERVCFLGGVVTAVLVWATGIWDRGVRWPRRWFATSNRGLRGFNCKLVVVKQPWWAEALSAAAWFLTYGLFSRTTACSYRYVEPALLRDVDRELNLPAHVHPSLPPAAAAAIAGVGDDEEKGGHEEDLSPGGDYVKLLLLPKPFSATFRENWELYRSEYWERENERRALIAARLRDRDYQLRRQHGGLFWWLPWRRQPAGFDDRQQQQQQQQQHYVGQGEKQHQPEKTAAHPRHLVVTGEHRRARSGSVRRGSMSMAAPPSRTPTPTIESEDMPGGGGGSGGVSRKLSNASTASDKRRKKLSTSSPSASGSSSSSSPRPQKRSGAEAARSLTPEMPSPLARETGSAPASPSAARPGSSAGDRLRPRSPSPNPAAD